jgi:hypothetical protein
VPSASERLLTPGRTRTPAPFPALVTRSDSTGVWCTPELGDPTRPIGPCLGATRPALVTSSGGDVTHTHTLTVERLPVGTRVLVLQLLNTDEPPWVLAYDREVSA